MLPLERRAHAGPLPDTLARYRNQAVAANVRARLRVYVKRVLCTHGYPPDKEEVATKTVLQQAEALSAEWLSEVP